MAPGSIHSQSRHSTFLWTSRFPTLQMVYAWKNASFNHGRIQLDNFGGLWVGDRTLSDKTSKFVPTPENVVFLPNITQLEAAGVVSAHAHQQRPPAFLLRSTRGQGLTLPGAATLPSLSLGEGRLSQPPRLDRSKTQRDRHRDKHPQTQPHHTAAPHSPTLTTPSSSPGGHPLPCRTTAPSGSGRYTQAGGGAGAGSRCMPAWARQRAGPLWRLCSCPSQSWLRQLLTCADPRALAGNWGAPLQDGTTTFACFDANREQPECAAPVQDCLLAELAQSDPVLAPQGWMDGSFPAVH